MTSETERCLIIPDIHQDIAWVERIFAQETGAEKVVFLGDYFDSRKSPLRRAGVTATCEYLSEVFRRLGDRGTFLLGNHDIQYLEAKPACDRFRTPRHLNYKCGSAYSHSAAAKIAKGLPKEFWHRARLFVTVNGWLLSHAGLASALAPQRASWIESMAALEADASTALLTMRRGPHPLLQAGKVRGGDATVGGITWLDWDNEFSDTLAVPQIVGHTPDEGPRQKGRSWCLDGQQSCYGVLTPHELIVRSC